MNIRRRPLPSGRPSSPDLLINDLSLLVPWMDVLSLSVPSLERMQKVSTRTPQKRSYSRSRCTNCSRSWGPKTKSRFTTRDMQC